MVTLIQKVVPVIIRSSNGKTELLLFHHPLAGDQIVKGTVEQNESYENAVLRELNEESGINNVTIVSKLGIREYHSINQSWHFFIIDSAEPLPNSWTHFTLDDGGLNFEFFWQDINQEIVTPWSDIFDDARLYIKNKLLLE